MSNEHFISTTIPKASIASLTILPSKILPPTSPLPPHHHHPPPPTTTHHHPPPHCITPITPHLHCIYSPFLSPAFCVLHLIFAPFWIILYPPTTSHVSLGPNHSSFLPVTSFLLDLLGAPAVLSGSSVLLRSPGREKTKTRIRSALSNGGYEYQALSGGKEGGLQSSTCSSIHTCVCGTHLPLVRPDYSQTLLALVFFLFLSLATLAPITLAGQDCGALRPHQSGCLSADRSSHRRL
jgi:hypothetical protein